MSSGSEANSLARLTFLSVSRSLNLNSVLGLGIRDDVWGIDGLLVRDALLGWIVSGATVGVECKDDEVGIVLSHALNEAKKVLTCFAPSLRADILRNAWTSRFVIFML